MSEKTFGREQLAPTDGSKESLSDVFKFHRELPSLIFEPPNHVINLPFSLKVLLYPPLQATFIMFTHRNTQFFHSQTPEYLLNLGCTPLLAAAITAALPYASIVSPRVDFFIELSELYFPQS
jgi:hypothetical protein